MGIRVSLPGAVLCLLVASCSAASNPSTPETSDGSVSDATSDSQGGNVDAPAETTAPSDGPPDVRDASSDASSPTPDAGADVSVADAEAGPGDAASDARGDTGATGDTGAPDGSDEAAAPTCPSAPPYNQACSVTSQYCTYSPDASIGGAQCCLCYQGSWLCVYDGEMGGGGGSGICPPTEPSGGICPYSDGPNCYYCQANGRIEEEQCVNGAWTGQSL